VQSLYGLQQFEILTNSVYVYNRIQVTYARVYVKLTLKIKNEFYIEVIII